MQDPFCADYKTIGTALNDLGGLWAMRAFYYFVDGTLRQVRASDADQDHLTGVDQQSELELEPRSLIASHIMRSLLNEGFNGVGNWLA